MPGKYPRPATAEENTVAELARRRKLMLDGGNTTADKAFRKKKYGAKDIALPKSIGGSK